MKLLKWLGALLGALLVIGGIWYEVRNPEQLTLGPAPRHAAGGQYVTLSAAGYRVLRYDVFGRGFSDRPVVTYDADLVDQQLGELLDSTGFRGPVHLMGLSFGGFVTGTFAGRHPSGSVRSRW